MNIKFSNSKKAIIFSMVLFSCSDAGKTADEQTYAKIQIDTAISNVSRQVKDLVYAGQLFLFDNFTNMYNHPSLYKKDIIHYLSLDTVSELDKTIAVYALKKLDEKDYIDFAVATSDLYLKNKISETIMNDIVYTVEVTNSAIVKNYDNPIVKNLLIKINTHPEASKDFINEINMILSGQFWKSLK